MGLSAEASQLLGMLKAGAEVSSVGERGVVPVSVLRELYANAGDDYDVQYFLAGCLETPSKILEELSRTCDAPMILARLAENLRTPKPVLQQLAHHERVEVRQAVAAGRGISPQAALILSEDSDASVRAILAENPAVTLRVQVRLSQDAVPFVRANLLKAPKLDEEIQFALCDDMDVAVQAKALLMPRISGESLLRWADGDESLSQRLLLLRNQLPEKVLESLLFSKDDWVRRQAVGRKALTEDELVGLARTGDDDVRTRIAGMASVSPLVQGLLAEDASPEVRKALAANGELDGGALEKLLAQADDDVDAVLAENCAIPVRALTVADSGRRAVLLRMAAGRATLTRDDVAFLAEQGDDAILYRLWYDGRTLTGVSHDTMRSLAHHALPSVRELAARSPELTIALMDDLCRDASPRVRLAVAENSETVESFLNVLAADADGRVARAAKRSLAVLPGGMTELEEREASTEAAVVEDSGDGEDAGEAVPAKDGLLKRFIQKLGM